MLVLAAARTARADALADARAAVDGSDYVNARTLLETAIKSGTHGPSDLAEIYRLTGIVDGALGESSAAQAAFAKWLALDAKASLPKGTSPKIMRPFEAAQAAAAKAGPLAAKADTHDEPPSVTLVVTNDPAKMIVAARVYFSVDHKAEQRLEADGKQRIKLELERGKRLDLRVQGLDEYGNRVIELGSKDVPIVITSSGPEPPEPPEPPVKPDKPDDKDRELVTNKRESPPPPPATPRAWYLQWWVWGTVGVIATGTGGYFAWRTNQDLDEIKHLNANSLDHPWSDEQAVERRARRDLLVTDIAGGAAGVFMLGAIVLYMTKPDVTTQEHVSAVPVRGGGAIVLGGHF
jgi:hypothetical protein